MKVRSGTQTAVVPRREYRAAQTCKTGFFFGNKAIDHRGTQGINARNHQRVKYVVERVTVRWPCQYRPGWAALVVVVHDLRNPIYKQLTTYVLGLFQLQHEEIAVVVVTGVFLIQTRQVVQRPFLGRRITHVPVGHEFLSVGVDVGKENDHIVQNPHYFGVGASSELIGGFDELHPRHGFVGVNPAVDPNDCLSFFGHGFGLGISQALGTSKFGGNFLKTRQFFVVFGRGNDHHRLVTSFFGLADGNQFHPVRSRQFLKIRFRLGERSQHVIIADVEPKMLLRGRNLCPCTIAQK